MARIWGRAWLADFLGIHLHYSINDKEKSSSGLARGKIGFCLQHLTPGPYIVLVSQLRIRTNHT